MSWEALALATEVLKNHHLYDTKWPSLLGWAILVLQDCRDDLKPILNFYILVLLGEINSDTGSPRKS